MAERMTATIIKEYQKKFNPKKMTIGEFKALGRDIRDRFGLTDKDALSLIRGDSNVLEIMAKHEESLKDVEAVANC